MNEHNGQCGRAGQKREKGKVRNIQEQEEQLVCLEAADRPRMRCDFSKLSCCDIVDGVLCLLG